MDIMSLTAVELGKKIKAKRNFSYGSHAGISGSD